MANRGALHLTRETFLRFKKYMKKMKGDRKTFYYAALPVLVRDAKRNVWVQPDGRKQSICF